DRYGARRVLFGGLALLSAGVLIAGMSRSYEALAFGIALGGLGNSVFHPADFAILNAAVSTRRMSYAFSVHGIVGYVGFAMAPVFGVWMADAYGWHAALIAGAGMVLAALLAVMAGAGYLRAAREAPVAAPLPLLQAARVLLSA